MVLVSERFPHNFLVKTGGHLGKREGRGGLMKMETNPPPSLERFYSAVGWWLCCIKWFLRVLLVGSKTFCLSSTSPQYAHARFLLSIFKDNGEVALSMQYQFSLTAIRF